MLYQTAFAQIWKLPHLRNKSPFLSMTYAKCFVYLVQFLRRLLSFLHVPPLTGFSPIGTQRHHEATEVTTGVTLKVLLQRRLKFWKYKYLILSVHGSSEWHSFIALAYGNTDKWNVPFFYLFHKLPLFRPILRWFWMSWFPQEQSHRYRLPIKQT